jgi:hypothetical protein
MDGSCASAIYMGRMKTNGWHRLGGQQDEEEVRSCTCLLCVSCRKGDNCGRRRKRTGLTGVVVLVLEEGIRLT